MRGPGLTVAATAHRLGVATNTLRTWDRRYGIGPSGHAPGRSRRYSSDDVARLELMQREAVRVVTPGEAARYALATPLPEGASVRVPPFDAPASNDRSRALQLRGSVSRAEGVGRAALAFDAAAAAGVLAASVDDNGVETTWDEVVRPVLAPSAHPHVMSALLRTPFRHRTFIAGPGWDGTEVPQRTARLASLGAAAAAIANAVTT